MSEKAPNAIEMLYAEIAALTARAEAAEARADAAAAALASHTQLALDERTRAEQAERERDRARAILREIAIKAQSGTAVVRWIEGDDEPRRAG